jgi:hypothetical protein
MSIKNLWQICHKKGFDNSMLTVIIAAILKESNFTTKQVAADLDVPTERVRHWYYHDTGMAALDFLKILHQYKLCSCLPYFLKSPCCESYNQQQRLMQKELSEHTDIEMIILRYPQLKQISITLECQVSDLLSGFSRIYL